MKTGIARGIMLSAMASLALAPMAAKAGTRASDTSSRYIASASGEPGLQRAADDEDKAAPLIGLDLQTFLLGSAIIGILVALAIDENERRIEAPSKRIQFQSNGAN